MSQIYKRTVRWRIEILITGMQCRYGSIVFYLKKKKGKDRVTAACRPAQAEATSWKCHACLHLGGRNSNTGVIICCLPGPLAEAKLERG